MENATQSDRALNLPTEQQLSEEHGQARCPAALRRALATQHASGQYSLWFARKLAVRGLPCFATAIAKSSL